MTINHSLSIQSLTLKVHLGWPQEERVKIQTVCLDADIQLPAFSPACLSDNLADTFCYSALIHELHAFVAEKHFHLIEHLCHEIYCFFKNRLPKDTALSIRITKRPKITGLGGGVAFSCQGIC